MRKKNYIQNNILFIILLVGMKRVQVLIAKHFHRLPKCEVLFYHMNQLDLYLRSHQVTLLMVHPVIRQWD